MSSNSSGDSVARLLRESLGVLEREHPVLHARMSARLTGAVLSFEVDDERFHVSFVSGTARVLPGRGASGLLLATSKQTLRAVLEARLALEDAVQVDAVRVLGPLELLTSAHEALRCYVHGAVRCPSFPALLTRLLLLLTTPP
ncbi:sterol-binding-like protein [Myxococcus sp. K15C18031901]|uniref:sterol-binding-like protein n=1 Tax=Myxococcus dinghuensis TaxID=2906761 RepID=UPI0020A70D21|nr:sterol-binding-like protein [Myxococcus dinghuensis]MCP3100720.1 sterol-binding-like protein [Myxococcus dinghuensis]